MSAVVVPIIPMIELKRVLFTTDFTDASQRALPILSAVAGRYGSKVFAAHVWKPGPYSRLLPEVIAALDRQSQHAVKSELDKLAKTAALEGIKLEPLVCCGEPAEEIGRPLGFIT
jgi:nucleotide-binding universal stress UspA family protein